jgi:hypothetical protein
MDACSSLLDVVKNKQHKNISFLTFMLIYLNKLLYLHATRDYLTNLETIFFLWN